MDQFEREFHKIMEMCGDADRCDAFVFFYDHNNMTYQEIMESTGLTLDELKKKKKLCIGVGNITTPKFWETMDDIYLRIEVYEFAYRTLIGALDGFYYQERIYDPPV